MDAVSHSQDKDAFWSSGVEACRQVPRFDVICGYSAGLKIPEGEKESPKKRTRKGRSVDFELAYMLLYGIT